MTLQASSNKIQKRLSKESLSKRLYDDVDDFRDLREERELQNAISYPESKKIRENFMNSVSLTVKKPNIVSDFMKAFSIETKQLSDLINRDKISSRPMPIPSTRPLARSTSSDRISDFTNTLINQSSLMKKLLSKKSKNQSQKSRSIFKDQIAK